MTERRGSWLQTYSGRQFFPLDARSEDVTIEDIAHALAATCRYNGHSRRFYSVAEHSVLVSQNVPEPYALHGLLHDATEAYCGDVIRPLKPSLVGFAEIEDNLADVIAERFALKWTVGAITAVKEIDDRILVDERDQIMAPPPAIWNLDDMKPLGVRIVAWGPAIAEALFLARFFELTDGGR